LLIAVPYGLWDELKEKTPQAINLAIDGVQENDVGTAFQFQVLDYLIPSRDLKRDI